MPRKIEVGPDTRVETGGRRTDAGGTQADPIVPSDLPSPTRPADFKIEASPEAKETKEAKPKKQPKQQKLVERDITSEPAERVGAKQKVPDISWADKHGLPARGAVEPERLLTSGLSPLVLEPGETANVTTAEFHPAPTPAAPKPINGMMRAELKEFIDSRRLTEDELDAVTARRDELTRLVTDMEPRPKVERVAELKAEQDEKPTPEQQAILDEVEAEKAAAKAPKPSDLNLFDDISTIEPEEAIRQAIEIIDRMLKGSPKPERVRGKTGRMLEAYPDNPAMLLLRGFSEVLCEDASVSTAWQNFRAAIHFAREAYGVSQADIDHMVDAMQVRYPQSGRGKFLVGLENYGLKDQAQRLKGSAVETEAEPQATDEGKAAEREASRQAYIAARAVEVEREAVRAAEKQKKAAEDNARAVRGRKSGEAMREFEDAVPGTPAGEAYKEKNRASIEAEPSVARPADIDTPKPPSPPAPPAPPTGPSPEDDRRLILEALKWLEPDYSRRQIMLDKLADPSRLTPDERSAYNQLHADERAAFDRHFEAKRIEDEEKRKAWEKNPPRSRIQQVIDFAVGLNQKNLKRGTFKLKKNPDALTGGDDISADDYAQLTWSSKIFDSAKMSKEDIEEIKKAIAVVAEFFVEQGQDEATFTITYANGTFNIEQEYKGEGGRELRKRKVRESPAAHAAVEELLNLFRVRLGDDSNFKIAFIEIGKGTEDNPFRPAIRVSERQRIDKKKFTIVHSPEVDAEIRKTLAYFGHRYSKTAERWLFIAFQIYRGIGVDRNGKVFGKTHEELEITDAEFIEALREMVQNVKDYNHPFSYSNQHKMIGGVERYPGITTHGLAVFFTKVQTDKNNLLSNTEDFIAYSVEEFTKPGGINDRMRSQAEYDQIESMYDLVEAALPGLGSQGKDVVLRELNGRRTLEEMILENTEFSEYASETTKENVREIRERVARATREKDAGRERGSLDARGGTLASAPMDSDAAGKDFGSFLKRLPTTLDRYRNSPHKIAKFFDGLVGVIKTLKTAGLIGLGVSSMPEKEMGYQTQRGGLAHMRIMLSLMARKRGENLKAEDMVPLPDSVARFREPIGYYAVHELNKLLVSQGVLSVTDAGARGVDFTTSGLHRERVGEVGRLMDTIETVGDVAQDILTADWMRKKGVAELFLQSFLYEMTKAHLMNGGPAYTAADLEANLKSGIPNFLRDAAQTPEGIAAIRTASDTSMGGTDPISAAVQKVLSNRLMQLATGFGLGEWFIKFGVRVGLATVPLAAPMMFIAKRLGTNWIRRGLAWSFENSGLEKGKDAIAETEADIKTTNELMLAGNDEFWFGLAQNMAVETARLGVKAPLYILAIIIVAAFRVSPPDEPPEGEPSLRHLWYEWKIGGVAVKTNWFFKETLAWAMPTAVGILAGIQTGDWKLARQIIYFGAMEASASSQWSNVFDVADFIGNFDQQLQDAQLASEGYSEGEEVSSWDFVATQTSVWFLENVIGAFDVAGIDQFRNEHGVYKGEPDLARSRHQINTGDPDWPVKQTTWADAQIRGVALRHPAVGAFLNYTMGIDSDDLNGYLKSQMPFATSSDGMQMMHWRQMSVFDPKTGDLIRDTEMWTPEQREDVGLRVLRHVEGKTATEIAAASIVIPKWARHVAVQMLYERKIDIKKAYNKRNESGEWTVVFGPDYAANGRALDAATQGRNDAKDKMYADQAVVQQQIDLMFSPLIPTSAQKYNRQEQTYREVYTWKVDGPFSKAGDPASEIAFQVMGEDKIDFKLYASGDHKSSILPISTVDNPNNTFDAQTQAVWQTDDTDLGEIISDPEHQSYVNPDGFNQGKRPIDILTGNGAVGPGAPDMSWDETRGLAGGRGLIAVPTEYDPLDPDDYKVLAEAAKLTYTEDDKKDKDGVRYYGGGGGGGYAPKIYSHAAYSINADKAASLYTKFPSYTRFDYLRPKVMTKGSREAYRREDF